jgi:hypothetical protein
MREAPEIALFIGRTESFKEPYRANITLLESSAELLFALRTQTVHYPSLKLVVKYLQPLFWPLSYLVRACRSSFLPLSTVERLDIGGVRWQSPTENTEWLEVFGLFVAVRDLCVSGNVALHVVQALQELSVERATEVLPALRNLFIEGLEASRPIQGAVKQFVAIETSHLRNIFILTRLIDKVAREIFTRIPSVSGKDSRTFSAMSWQDMAPSLPPVKLSNLGYRILFAINTCQLT